MKYKAMMIDIDGTLIDYDSTALPTKRVRQAVVAASKLLTVCVATGRSYPSAERIINALSLHSGVAIINNGAQVIDLEDKKVMFEKNIPQKDAEQIFTYLATRRIPLTLIPQQKILYITKNTIHKEW